MITFGRLIGGFVVERIGRFRTILLSTLITASGILVFMLVEVIPSLSRSRVVGTGNVDGLPDVSCLHE